MGPIKFITRGFIDFFGITQPHPEEERRVGWIIIALLGLIVLGAAAVFAIVVFAFGHQGHV